MTRLALAEGFAARSWFPFPCVEGMKRPATRSGFEAGTNDLVTIRRWWTQHDYNIGIWTGKANLVVIDLDVKPEKGPPGMDAWILLCDKHGLDYEQTYCVVTPSGGLHVYFAVEDGYWYPPSTSTSQRVGVNIDVRSSGSYVVADGSEIDGIFYEACTVNELLSLPDWLGAMIDTPPPDVDWMERKHSLDAKANDAARFKAFRGIADHLAMKAQAGVDRNSYFYWAVRAVGDHLWPDDFKVACVEELIMIGHELGLTDKELADSARSAQRRWP